MVERRSNPMNVDRLFSARHLSQGDHSLLHIVKQKPSLQTQRFRASSLWRLVFAHRLKQKRNKDFIKIASAKHAILNLIRKLQVQNGAFMHDFDVRRFPTNIFVWSPQKFLVRVAQENVLYLDVVTRALSSEETEIYKFKTDIQEVVLCAEEILKQYESGGLSNKLLATLKYYIRNFDFEKTIHVVFSSAVESQVSQAFKKIVKHRKTIFEIGVLRQELAPSHYIVENICPIELRHAVKWYRTAIEQEKFQDELALCRFSDDIDKLQRRIIEDTFLYKCAMDMYYVQMENYKTRISALIANYENDLEYLDNETMTMQLNISKLYEQLKFYQAKVEMFKLKVTETLAQIEAEDKSKQRSQGADQSEIKKTKTRTKTDRKNKKAGKRK